ncbi:unnamed protein product [Larinioides sclopetarius]|uniref:Photosystem II protein I n=1 Tax=Larinioides sclopetarius TaxID=280406 RepID=A0AAV2ATI9_9ARAC
MFIKFLCRSLDRWRCYLNFFINFSIFVFSISRLQSYSYIEESFVMDTSY